MTFVHLLVSLAIDVVAISVLPTACTFAATAGVTFSWPTRR